MTKEGLGIWQKRVTAQSRETLRSAGKQSVLCYVEGFMRDRLLRRPAWVGTPRNDGFKYTD